jgi:hypothetical protein
MMNWPTAFVIAVAICAGGFLYNKPSDAAFGGSDRYSIRINDYWVQFDGNKQRMCLPKIQSDSFPIIKCYPWKTD